MNGTTKIMTIAAGVVAMLSGCGVTPGGGQGGVNINICNSANTNGDCNQSGTNSNVSQTQVTTPADGSDGTVADADGPPGNRIPHVSSEEPLVIQANHDYGDLLRVAGAVFRGRVSGFEFVEQPPDLPVTVVKFVDVTWYKGGEPRPINYSMRFLGGPFISTAPDEQLVVAGQHPAFSIGVVYVVALRKGSYGPHPIIASPLGQLRKTVVNDRTIYVDASGRIVVGWSGNRPQVTIGVASAYAPEITIGPDGESLLIDRGGIDLIRQRRVDDNLANLKSDAIVAADQVDALLEECQLGQCEAPVSSVPLSELQEWPAWRDLYGRIPAQNVLSARPPVLVGGPESNDVDLSPGTDGGI